MPQAIQPCDEVGISPELKAQLDSLPEDHKFNRWIKQDMRDALLYNRRCGEQIEISKIPKKYRIIYEINNLYHYGHPEGYRSCYTILHVGNNIFHGWILDLLSHNEYEDLFGYR